MDSDSRMNATKMIMIALVLGLGIVNVPLFNGDTLQVEHVILNVLVLGCVVTCLGFVWNWGALPSATHVVQAAEREKSKRRDRIDTLLDSLDDDEVDALRRRLAADEGQQVDLNTLLKDDAELSRR